MTLSLRCEINTLGYPKAALFGFCMAASLFNVLSVMRAARRAAHGGKEVEENLSIYYVADEVAGVSRGMTAILPPCYWRQRFGNLSVVEMAEVLLTLAKVIDRKRFQNGDVSDLHDCQLVVKNTLIAPAETNLFRQPNKRRRSE